MKLFLLFQALLLWDAPAIGPRSPNRLLGSTGSNAPFRQLRQALRLSEAVRAAARVEVTKESERVPADRSQSQRTGSLFARAHWSNSMNNVSDVPDMTPEEIEAAYDDTKDLLRRRSDDYVRIDAAMHGTSQQLTSNSTTLNVTVDRNIEDLASAVDVAEDQYKTVHEDIVAQAHANYSNTLMTAKGAERHGMTPEMRRVVDLEDELHKLKRSADSVFDAWISSDVVPTATSPPTADILSGKVSDF